MLNNLRAEKTTKNADDFRVLLAGSVVAILFMLIAPVIDQKWDQYGASRPFVHTETLELIEVKGSNFPMFNYDADSNKTLMPATWIATIYTEEGYRLLSRRGTGNYNSREDGPKLWTWYSWFDNEIGLPAPEVPIVPFKACVRYIAIAPSGVMDESPEYCTEIYTPKIKD